ncbi:MAG: nitrilase-related carbon-nitrogen hydrolase [Phycisphaerae bacterium]
MRIAVVQPEASPGHRAATLQRALHAIDLAAGHDPAPDLILLPAFADAPAVVADMPFSAEHLHGATTAACGGRARFWGLFVVLGLAEKGIDKPYLTTVLIDRDGDIRRAHRQVACGAQHAARFAPGTTLTSLDFLLGRAALFAGDDLFDAVAWDAAVEARAQFVLGSACWMRTVDRSAGASAIRTRIAAQAKRCGLWCAVADITEQGGGPPPRCGGFSTVFDDRGNIVVAADPGTGSILQAEVRLPERAPTDAEAGTMTRHE